MGRCFQAAKHLSLDDAIRLNVRRAEQLPTGTKAANAHSIRHPSARKEQPLWPRLYLTCGCRAVPKLQVTRTVWRLIVKHMLWTAARTCPLGLRQFLSESNRRAEKPWVTNRTMLKTQELTSRCLPCPKMTVFHEFSRAEGPSRQTYATSQRYSLRPVKAPHATTATHPGAVRCMLPVRPESIMQIPGKMQGNEWSREQ